MTGQLVNELSCVESGERSESGEEFTKLQVHIGAGVATYMLSDLETSLTEEIEKRSDVLGRNAIFKKQSKISRLPKYLATSFVRYIYSI